MRQRIIWITALLTFAALLFFSFLSSWVYYQSSVDDAQTYLRTYVNFYDESIGTDAEAAAYFSEMLDGVRVTFLDLDGQVLADSDADEIETDHSDREEVVEALSSGEGFAVRSSDTLGRKMLYYCRRCDSLLVRLAVYISSFWAIFAQNLPALLCVLLIDLVLCVTGCYFATDYILKPVKQLAQQAQQGKKLECRYSELQPIADVLDERNRKIEKDMARIEHEKEAALQAKQSKDELVANVTHEMNTPLTSIKGFAELLEGDSLTDEQRRRAVAIIRAQSERLSGLISAVLRYSELDDDTGPSYDVDFSSLIRETLKTFEPAMAEKNITLRTDIADGVKIYSTYDRLLVVFNNLMSNAIRYNRVGGEVSVTLGHRGEYAELTVADTGIGIAEADMSKVFSRFYTVDKSHNGKGGGYGLGLAVVRKLCNRAGWTIDLKSELGKGTSFTVVF